MPFSPAESPAPAELPASSDLPSLVAFGAHPDDIEFGCGGVIARESLMSRSLHFVVCSHGEAGTNGTPEQRKQEASNAARILGATIEFIELDGDAHLEVRAVHAIKIAAILRRLRPGVLLAPSLMENQHPDHWRLGRLVRDAARLARYGGLKELRDTPPHAISQLLYYAVTAEAEPRDLPVLMDVSDPQVIQMWTEAMAAHVSQQQTRNYSELQLTRARLHGLRAGIGHAIPLWPNDPLTLDSLTLIERAARKF
jgi:N-acetylglucosamine malate deacetylase 1